MLKIVLGVAVGAWVFAGEHWVARACVALVVLGVIKLAMWARQ